MVLDYNSDELALGLHLFCNPDFLESYSVFF